MTTIYGDEFGSDACGCPICRYNAEDASNDANDDKVLTQTEFDAELDQIVSEIFKNTTVPVDAPVDVDVVFDALFGQADDYGRNAPSHDPRDYPFGPIWFNKAEIVSIRNALRLHGTTVCEMAMNIVDPANDAHFNSLSDDEQVRVSALVTEAIEVSEDDRRLYDFFGDYLV